MSYANYMELTQQYQALITKLADTLDKVAHILKIHIYYPGRDMISLPELAKLLARLRQLKSIAEKDASLSLAISELIDAGASIKDFVLATVEQAYSDLMADISIFYLDLIRYEHTPSLQSKTLANEITKKARLFLTSKSTQVENIFDQLTAEQINCLIMEIKLWASLESNYVATIPNYEQREALTHSMQCLQSAANTTTLALDYVSKLLTEYPTDLATLSLFSHRSAAEGAATAASSRCDVDQRFR